MIRPVYNLIKESRGSLLPISICLFIFTLLYVMIFATFLIIKRLYLLILKETSRTARKRYNFARHVSLRNLLHLGSSLQVKIKFSLRQHTLMLKTMQYFFKVFDLNSPLV